MRRLQLFTALSIVATLVFAPTALAQQSGPAFNFLEVPEGTPPCPLGLDEVKEIYGPNVTCGEGGGYVLTTSDSSTPPATSSPTASPTSSVVPDVQNQVSQVGEGNVACVQTAIQQEFGKVQISQYGDNVNIQSISQECNISVTEVEAVIASATASATASASASHTATASASSAPAAVQYQYQYAAPSATASAAAELPPTGGSSLIALGAGVLLVAGGLLARRIVR